MWIAASRDRKPFVSCVLAWKHIESKVQTFTVESYTSLFQYFLARLRRQSKRLIFLSGVLYKNVTLWAFVEIPKIAKYN